MLAESEKILLGSWLLGYNREHIGEFSPGDFPYNSQVCKAIQEQRKDRRKIELVEVTNKAALPVTELMETTRLYQPSFYEGAYRELKQYRIKRMLNHIDNTTDLEKAVKCLAE